MYTLALIIQYFFPLIALILLVIGMKRPSIHYVVSSLWLCLIALLLHFQLSGNEIFGNYFTIDHAAIYTFTLLVLITSLVYILFHLSINSSVARYSSSLISALMVVSALLFITNIWINAFFIENKKTDTPIMQVAVIEKPDYCSYKYVFYKVNPDDSVSYLCPNYYGLIASVGRLSTNPAFISTYLPLSAQHKNGSAIKK